MVIEDYKSLASPEQWYEIYEYGTYLAYFQGTFYDYTIYALHNFFVEVVVDPITNREITLNVFEGGDYMDRYLDEGL